MACLSVWMWVASVINDLPILLMTEGIHLPTLTFKKMTLTVEIDYYSNLFLVIINIRLWIFLVW